jgi:hypothetical protein
MATASLSEPLPLSERLLRPWTAFWFAPSDATTLSVMRVVVGAIAFYWAATYTSDLTRFLGPHGLFPLSDVHLARGSTFPRSYFEFAATDGAVWALHAVSLAILALFTVGMFTRITSVLALVAVLSYIHRAPPVTSQAEPILVMLLLYLCVGPCGAKLSVDRMLKLRKEPSARGRDAIHWTATLSTRLIQVHLTMAYAAMALAKLNDGVPADDNGMWHTWWMGDAVWWLAARPYSPIVDVTGVLTNNVLLVNAWTHAIVLFKAGFAIFIWRPAFRRVLLWIAVPMWLSLALITGLVPFCLLMLAGNLAFVRPEEMQRAVGSLAP